MQGSPPCSWRRDERETAEKAAVKGVPCFLWYSSPRRRCRFQLRPAPRREWSGNDGCCSRLKSFGSLTVVFGSVDGGSSSTCCSSGLSLSPLVAAGSTASKLLPDSSPAHRASLRESIMNNHKRFSRTKPRSNFRRSSYPVQRGLLFQQQQ